MFAKKYHLVSLAQANIRGGRSNEYVPTYSSQQWVYSASTDFFLVSNRIRVNLLSYETQRTDKQEQYKWMAGKIWSGSSW